MQQVIELSQADLVWQDLRREAAAAAAEEPALAGLVNGVVLNHGTMAEALGYRLAHKLAGTHVDAITLSEVFAEAFAGDPAIMQQLVRDLRAVRDRDPACRTYLQ